MTPYRYYFAVTQESVGATVWLTIPASDTEPCTFQLYRNGQPESAPFTEEQILDVWQGPGVQLYTQYNLWRAVSHLSKLLEQDGRLEDAGRCHLRLLPYAPNYLALYEISGAVLRLANETGRFIQAAAGFKQALLREPADPRSWYLVNNNLGYCLAGAGRYADAERYSREAIKTDASPHYAHKNLGLALQGQGKLVDAAHCFVTAAVIEPLDTRAAAHLRDLIYEHPEICLADPEIGAKFRLICGDHACPPASQSVKLSATKVTGGSKP